MGGWILITDKYRKKGQKWPKKAKIGLKLGFFKNQPLGTPQISYFQDLGVFLGVKFNSKKLLFYEFF